MMEVFYFSWKFKQLNNLDYSCSDPGWLTAGYGLVGACLLSQPSAWCLLQVNCRMVQASRSFKMRLDISLGAFVPTR